ncbi:MAG: 2-succinyl-6-hydroxy-2,4-cyclohexadiene-1-carboxylate synthase [Oscillochloridaceae bacterium umkhey_bin13]
MHHDLAYELVGSGPPLLLLHGFTGSRAEWAVLSPMLAAHHELIMVDLIGHGESPAPADPAAYPLEGGIADLLNLLDRLGLAQVDLLGYSMGGRVALQLACTAPERIKRLILLSASPGLADPAERAARIASDEALADKIEARGLHWFVDHWASIPLFASQQTNLSANERAALRQRRLQGNPSGYANSLRGMGTGRMANLWPALPTLNLPTLLITGALDAKFVALGQQMAAALPQARHVSLPAVGHAVHLEQPQACAKLVVGFLREP